MKKKIIGIVLVGVMAASLAACGGGAKKETQAPAATEAAAAQYPSATVSGMASARHRGMERMERALPVGD